ncbi:CmpA/NrtA family ABC transporter substrate-binding protein [Verrucomicrobium sp. GAS474]|uniref:CmpA/NrtA family ABC transporter substrate-binding protein n=1 Tax=Verrucomicrobium sp. GAS474 TaxID=1882831 RepID=UPI0012FFAE28|nr:CmpA/NrtA family ABC transporter substrate-binding protein [Verrucomicrobium sp. GAS474]
MGFKPVRKTSPRVRFPTRVQIGFLPMVDAAPVIAAKEMGFFRKHGLEVSLVREDDWKILQHRMADKEIDAAHSPVGMGFGLKLGVGGYLPMSVFTALVTNIHGNAIFFSRSLVEKGIRHGADLLRAIRDGLFESRGKETGLGKPVFGYVSPFSAHYYVLRRWLAASGIDPRDGVVWRSLLPKEIPAALRDGEIDGFCLSEPWGTMVQEAGTAERIALGSDFSPGHPDKILLVRGEMAGGRREEHLSLVAAVLEACRWCDAPENRTEMADILSERPYLHMKKAFVEQLLPPAESLPAALSFHAHDANRPSQDKGAWVLGEMIAAGVLPPELRQGANYLIDSVFRSDLFAEAEKLCPRQAVLI